MEAACVDIPDRAHDELDELLHHHCREVGVRRSVLQLRVPHEQHRASVLHCEHDQRAPLLPSRDIARHMRYCDHRREWLALFGRVVLVPADDADLFCVAQRSRV